MDADDLPAVELVAAAMEILDAGNAPQLADRLGMTRRNQDKTVRRWIEGTNEPSYAHTLRLLSEVGLLPAKLPARTDGSRFGPGRATSGPARALDDEALAVALEELGDLLEQQDAVLERLLDRAAEQARPRRGRKRSSG